MLKDLNDGFGTDEYAETRWTFKVSLAVDGPVILAFLIRELEPQPRARRECRIPNVSNNPLTSIFAQDCLPKLERKIAHNRNKLVMGALRS
jgi:molybdopterin-guanine dinucleotide biosynthesis protein A